MHFLCLMMITIVYEALLLPLSISRLLFFSSLSLLTISAPCETLITIFSTGRDTPIIKCTSLRQAVSRSSYFISWILSISISRYRESRYRIALPFPIYPVCNRESIVYTAFYRCNLMIYFSIYSPVPSWRHRVNFFSKDDPRYTFTVKILMTRKQTSNSTRAVPSFSVALNRRGAEEHTQRPRARVARD